MKKKSGVKIKTNRFKTLKQKIIENSSDIVIPDKLNKQKIDISTNIDVNKFISDNPIINKNFPLKHDNLDLDPIKTRKYVITPTEKQHNIFQKWFDAYIDMYNHIVHHIRSSFITELRINPTFKLVDFNINLNITHLKKLFSPFKKILDAKYNITNHILDYAISDAVAMYKSKISNLKNGHIKKSRLRYLKKTNNTKIFKVEKDLCTNNSFCTSIIGKTLDICPKIDLINETDTVLIVQYNKGINKYFLLVRKRINGGITELTNYFDDVIENCDQVKSTSMNYLNVVSDMKKSSKRINFDANQIKPLNQQNDKIKRKMKNNKIYDNKMNIKHKISTNVYDLSIDPGIRKMITGLSNDHIIEIGGDLFKTIKRYLQKIDKINGNETVKKGHLMSDTQKKNLIGKIEEKIKNKVDDYHWKIIDYLTSNYRYISIGNFSTKRMGEGDIGSMIKRVGQRFRLYVFRQRLKYKCYLKGIKYHKVDEYCTSKTCSKCGYFKKDLGSNKIYRCQRCKLKIGRDINASKNMYLKSIK